MKTEIISSSAALQMLKCGSAEKSNVYELSEKLILSSDASYNGNGVQITAPYGIVFDGISNTKLENAVITGNIIISNSSAISVVDCKLTGSVSIDESCKNIAFSRCEIVSSYDFAVQNKGKGFILYNSSVSATHAILSLGADVSIRQNKIESTKSGITLSSGSVCCLIAENTLTGAGASVNLDHAHNCSVILNTSDGISAENCHDIYVIDNKCNSVSLFSNKHLICDGNKLDTSKINSSDNTEFNGDNLTNVEKRLDVGACEELLPHTNKDLFLGMERKDTLIDPTTLEEISVNEYILKEAQGGSVVIVPPGAYRVNETLNLTADHSNTVIYAYGVYHEAVEYIKNLGLLDVSELTLKGLTIGYAKQSAGQIQVLEKLDDYSLRVISSAGFTREFGKLDPDVFAGGGYFYHPGKHYQWTELGYWGTYDLVPNENGENINEDGTFVIKLGGGDDVPRHYALIEKGEIFSCRLKPKSDRTVSISNSTNILLKDTVTYGYAGALCFVIGGTSKGVKFYRHHNLSHSAYEIDRETYEKYVALEEKYGVDLEVYIDEMGRYRGAKPRMGSVDATHIVGSSQGLSATSTLFENACDDATNQRSESSCLHKAIDNGDGTCTLIYKDNMPWVYYHIYKRRGKTNNPGMRARNFLKGERIFSYTSNGKILCDTTVLSDAEIYEKDYVMYEEDYEYNGEMLHMKWLCDLFAVKVKAEDVDLSALEGYNTEISHYTMDNKVIVDNVSRNSTNFIFDNCMTRHNRGRVIIKTRDATIRNCTFTDNSYAGVVLSVESSWGESSVPCNVAIEKCLFDGTSREFNRNDNTKYAGLAVEGLGDRSDNVIVSENTIPSKNISICGNVFRNIQNDYYVTISAAQGVTIRGNTFEKRDNDTSEKIGKAIFINGCMNVDISDNTYAAVSDGDVAKVIVAKNYKNLSGTDVEGKLPGELC